MEKLTSRATAALVLALMLAGGSLFAASPNDFYLSLLNRGIAQADAGNNAAAIGPLRIAAFGLVETIPQFALSEAYIAVVAQRLQLEPEARHAMQRLLAAERLQRTYGTIPLPPEVRAELERIAPSLLTEDQLALLHGGTPVMVAEGAASPGRPATETMAAAMPQPETPARPPMPEPQVVTPAPEPEPSAPMPEPQPQPSAVTPEPQSMPTPAPEPLPMPMPVVPTPTLEPQPVAPGPAPTPEPQVVTPAPQPATAPASPAVAGSPADFLTRLAAADAALARGDVQAARAAYWELIAGPESQRRVRRPARRETSRRGRTRQSTPQLPARRQHPAG